MAWNENKTTAIILPCCNISVSVKYKHCPKCGRVVNHNDCKKVKVHTCSIDLLDYDTWNCSCGGCERISYNFCPMCGKKRTSEKEDTIEIVIPKMQ